MKSLILSTLFICAIPVPVDLDNYYAIDAYESAIIARHDKDLVFGHSQEEDIIENHIHGLIKKEAESGKLITYIKENEFWFKEKDYTFQIVNTLHQEGYFIWPMPRHKMIGVSWYKQ